MPQRFGALLPDREIRLRCAMPEKFLEKAREEGVGVAQAECGADDELCLRVQGRDAERLRGLAQKYSLRIVSDRAVGRDPMRLIGAAWPFAAGFLACAAALWSLTGFIWQIDVRCPEGGDARGVISALEQAGVVTGSAFPQEDPLARELESLCPGFAHISVRRDGVVLLVEAYRETDAPDIYDTAAARDLVAKYDAVVEEIVVLSGKAAVQPGDVVKKGQVLILGEEKATDETTRGVSALGDVTGRVFAYAEAQADSTQQIKVYTGQERVRASLRLFGWTLPLRDTQDFAQQETQTERIAVGGMFLPLHIERETLRETAWETKPVDENAQKAALEAQSMAEAMSQLPENAQIIDKWTDYSMMEGDRLVMRVCVQARLPIAAVRAQLDEIRDTP